MCMPTVRRLACVVVRFIMEKGSLGENSQCENRSRITPAHHEGIQEFWVTTTGYHSRGKSLLPLTKKAATTWWPGTRVIWNLQNCPRGCFSADIILTTSFVVMPNITNYFGRPKQINTKLLRRKQWWPVIQVLVSIVTGMHRFQSGWWLSDPNMFKILSNDKKPSVAGKT